MGTKGDVLLKLSRSSICFYCLLSIGLVLVACKETKPLESPLISVKLYPTSTALPMPTPVPTVAVVQAPEATPMPEVTVAISPTPNSEAVGRLEPTPTSLPEWEKIASTVTQTLKSGVSLVIQNVQHFERNLLMSRIRVIRGNRATWLTPGRALKQRYNYPQYGFASSYCVPTIINLDRDNEPELIFHCVQGEPGEVRSLHIYRWDRGAYRLILEKIKSGLQFDVSNDFNQDGYPEIVIQYKFGMTGHYGFHWLEVFNIRKNKLVDANVFAPNLFAGLLTELHNYEAKNMKDLNDHELQADAIVRLAELHTKIAEAEAIVVKANKVNE